jgi:uncharacterized damage-inducible protein DinB
MSDRPAADGTVLSPEALLAHWQGHRRLTRRVIEAFPKDQLFTFSLGGMRPFGEMSLELLSMAEPMVRQIVTGEYGPPAHRQEEWRDGIKGADDPGARILALWDEGTTEINALWAQITPGRFDETMKAFGQYEARIGELVFYLIDNEIHHRGQGYVYLRALGIEPPPFWERD